MRETEPRRPTRSAPACEVCGHPCQGEAFVLYSEDDETPHNYCCAPCLVDGIERQGLLDDRVKKVIADECNELHQMVCPACKKHVRDELAKVGTGHLT